MLWLRLKHSHAWHQADRHGIPRCAKNNRHYAKITRDNPDVLFHEGDEPPIDGGKPCRLCDKTPHDPVAYYAGKHRLRMIRPPHAVWKHKDF